MNLEFRPRFATEPFVPALWTYLSLGGNFLFGLLLLIFPKTRFLAFIPLVFTLFPLAFLILCLSGEGLRNLIPGSEAAGGLDWKFLYDCLFFTAELAFIGLFWLLSRTGKPLALVKPPRRPLDTFVKFWEFFFIIGVFSLLAILLYRSRERFPPGRLIALLKYQIPFALLLGLKEELLFRWALLRKMEELLGSRLLAVCALALVWSLYHGFFGEGIGAGFWPAFWVCVVSFWWSLLSYRYNTLWPAWTGHTALELYGFYLMYIPFMG
jgi:membrane protease YdiL (CAAX protease family)